MHAAITAAKNNRRWLLGCRSATRCCSSSAYRCRTGGVARRRPRAGAATGSLDDGTVSDVRNTPTPLQFCGAWISCCPTVHPIFQPWFATASDENAAQFVVNVVSDLAASYCGPVLVKETGIPTAPVEKGFTEKRQASFYVELQRRFAAAAGGPAAPAGSAASTSRPATAMASRVGRTRIRLFLRLRRPMARERRRPRTGPTPGARRSALGPVRREATTQTSRRFNPTPHVPVVTAASRVIAPARNARFTPESSARSDAVMMFEWRRRRRKPLPTTSRPRDKRPPARRSPSQPNARHNRRHRSANSAREPPRR